MQNGFPEDFTAQKMNEKMEAVKPKLIEAAMEEVRKVVVDASDRGRSSAAVSLRTTVEVAQSIVKLLVERGFTASMTTSGYITIEW